MGGPIGPLNADLPVITFGDISAAGGPSDQWDALPSSAKLQILGAVGFLEMCGEASVFLEADGQQHYVRGGKPGYYPTSRTSSRTRSPSTSSTPSASPPSSRPSARRRRSSPRSTTAASPCLAS